MHLLSIYKRDSTTNTTPEDQTLVDIFSDEDSDEDNVINKKVSNEQHIKAMTKAQQILSKYKNTTHNKMV